MTQELFEALYNDSCSSVTRDLLAQEYPTLYKQMLEDRNVFDFNFHHQINTSFADDSPLVIANGYAPNGLKLKCLIVHDDYRLEVFEHKGKTMLKFVKK